LGIVGIDFRDSGNLLLNLIKLLTINKAIEFKRRDILIYGVIFLKSGVSKMAIKLIIAI
jgi:hypothetical protein